MSAPGMYWMCRASVCQQAALLTSAGGEWQAFVEGGAPERHFGPTVLHQAGA